jgi:lipid-A-disaccharide synthase
VPGAVYVGHPYFDELAERHLDEDFLAEQQAEGEPVVALLPGSRTQELERNFPLMLKAAAEVARHRPDVRFAVACLHERHRARALELIREAGAEGLRLEVHTARTPELIRLADVAWAVSGSVGLELMMEALPTVVVYKIRPIDLRIARPFIKSRYISLVNLLADAEVMPEYLTDRDVSAELARWALTWLDDPEARRDAASALASLRDRVALPGASDRAAERIAEVLRARPRVDSPAGPLARPSRNGKPRAFARRSP